MAKGGTRLDVTISSVQMEFLEALMEVGEISHDKAVIVQHLIWREMERRRVEGTLPPKVVIPERKD